MTEVPTRVLPEDVRPEVRRATWLTVAMLGYLAADITVLYLLASGSQSVFALVVEDALEAVAPLAFLLSARTRTRKPDEKYPYGYHRAVTLGAFASAVALLAFGTVLLLLSARSLLRGTHPTIGSLELFGHHVWIGWLVLAWFVIGAATPMILGRKLLGPAQRANNKVLYQSARMLAADWQTTAAAAVGVVGIAFGLWWLDSVAAVVIALSVVRDGVRNTRRTGGALMDRTPTEVGSGEVLDLVHRLERLAERSGWVVDAEVRLREVGQVYFGEVLVTVRDDEVSMGRIDELGGQVRGVDWRLQEVLVVPVRGRGGDVRRAAGQRAPSSR